MASETLDQALRLRGAPLYVFHEIVHNKHVVGDFRDRGVVFVESVADVPEGANLLFSAHGVSPAIRAEASRRGIRAIDATCPLVTKVHIEATRFARQGYSIVLIGHAGHDEVAGTMGEAPEHIVLVQTPEEAERFVPRNPERIAYLTQTTLSVDEALRVIEVLRRRFPHIVAPRKEDICYATQNRQEAVRELARQAQLVLVVGSGNSSNSIRLAEVAREHGCPAHLIDDTRDIDRAWFRGVETVVLTAGASAPEHLVTQCIDWLRDNFQAQVEQRAVREENVRFPLPRAVRPAPTTARPPASTLPIIR
jgi:4-hydroxy-3-methylbut-2-enyl diphosphate reductase